MMRPIISALLIATIAIVCSKAASAQTPADMVLLNGKVVTVDDRFTIAEALAVKGERILAVGSTMSAGVCADAGFQDRKSVV